MNVYGATIEIILRDRNQDLVDAWKIFFRNTDVKIGMGDIFDVSAEALVSPANAGGFLNGGIDQVYTNKFGKQLQDTLQKYLMEHYFGELPVGQAVCVPIGIDSDFKYLISAPTMHVPMSIAGTINAYLAFRAALKTAKEQNIKSILCPGLGTNVGRMAPDIAACQMRQAYRVIVEGKYPTFQSIGDLYGYHESLRRGIL